MKKDYYKILRIKKNARLEDIKKAYHNLALRYHPDKNKDPDSEQRFKEVLEAYQVLSDKHRRFKYDAEWMTDFSFESYKNDKKTFSRWTNPYDDFDIDNMDDYTLGAFMHFLSTMKNASVYRFDMYGSTSRKTKPKKPPIEYNLYVTLEELCSGILRKVRYTRLAYGGQMNEEKVLEVNVHPGCKTGTKILFPREGDRIPGHIPADVIFIVREKPHEFFERAGADLKMIVKVPLHLALRGNFTVAVPTLEGRLIEVPIKDELIKPNMVKSVPRKGLPTCKDPNKRGNILVTFKIKYPESMSQKTRKMIAKSLFN